MPRTTMILGSIVITSLFLGCKKKESSAASTEETPESLALSEASAKKSFDLVSSAISSFDDAITKAAGSLAIEDNETTLLEEEERPNLSKWCSAHAEPLATADKNFSSLYLSDSGNLLSAIEKPYAARLFHCKMKVDSGDPESIRGVIGMPKGLICALENANFIDFDNPGTSTGKKITMDTDCFSQNFLDSMTSQGYDLETSLDIETSVLTGVEGGWQKKVVLSNISIDSTATIEIYLFNSSEQMGLMVKQINNENAGEQTVSSFALTQTGILRIETKTYRMASSKEDNRFSLAFRVLAQGTLNVETDADNVSAKFSSFDSYDGIFTSLSRSSDVISGKVATITGTVDAGFLTKTYTCNLDGVGNDNANTCDPSKSIDEFYEVNNGTPYCVPSGKACKGLKALTFKDTHFFMTETNVKTAKYSANAWGDKLIKPLDFTTVTGDFAQYPE